MLLKVNHIGMHPIEAVRTLPKLAGIRASKTQYKDYQGIRQG